MSRDTSELQRANGVSNSKSEVY